MNVLDEEFENEVDEELERAVSEAQDRLEEMQAEETGSCNSCQILMINRVRTHEHGCPRYARLKAQRRLVERLENQ